MVYDCVMSRFTLVELMIVVGIIAILAAIAIPAWTRAQMRVRRAEVYPNIGGIRVAEEAYNAAWDAYLQVATFNPTGAPGKQKQSFQPGSRFDTLGWAPDGDTYGQYAAYTVLFVGGFCNPAVPVGQYHEAVAVQDLDAAGHSAYFVATGTKAPRYCTCNLTAHSWPDSETDW